MVLLPIGLTLTAPVWDEQGATRISRIHKRNYTGFPAIVALSASYFTTGTVVVSSFLSGYNHSKLRQPQLKTMPLHPKLLPRGAVLIRSPSLLVSFER